ncbi:MAG TPA: RNA polymerase sigma factor SigM [Propionibacteriaceae bacterium]|nr:RNA polymerase sigma factor SigM [Propionibacteriaceae bacterium]
MSQGLNPHSLTSPTVPAARVPETPVPTDAELLRAHVAGDTEAFAALVRRHQDRLWAVALRVMRNPEDAADALQDAYIAAFRRAGSYRGDAAVTTWLHRVVVNACLDRLRSLKVRAADALPEDLDRSSRLGVDQPVDPMELADQRDQVTAALDRLNADQRAALVLVDIQGYSVEEAATILGCAPGTVKSRCARGRAKLAPILAAMRPRSTSKGDDPLEPPPRAQQHPGAREPTSKSEGS